jgi:hypothetical protein
MAAGAAPNHPTRVLSLDGGGTWAVLQLLTLIEAFGLESTGHQVLETFDLAVGNSGGAVILACLALDQPLSKILTLYSDGKKRRSAFQPATLVEGVVHAIAGGKLPIPQYSTALKREAFAEHLGQEANVTLSAWKAGNPRLANLLITAFDYDVERVTFFRSDTRSRAESRSRSSRPDPTLLDAVNASANPPVLYFDQPAEVFLHDGNPPRRYWDGAVAGYNNPALAGVVEAMAHREHRRQDVRVLSVGNGTVHRPRRPPGVPTDDPRFMGGEPTGIIADLRKFSGAIVDDPPDAATFIAHVTLGGDLPRDDERISEGPIVRMNPVVRPVSDGRQWSWPTSAEGEASLGPAQWAALTQLALDALADQDMALIGRLWVSWHRGEARNQPIRARDDTLDAEIGHDLYDQARQAAKAMGLLPATSHKDDAYRAVDLLSGAGSAASA